MIEGIKELATTPTSHFFCSAVKRCGMEEYGYIEREFIFSGTANIYGTGADGRPKILYPAQKYTDRMSLRIPSDPTKFSGKIVVEIVNSTANYDIERIWAESYRYIMRHGHIYVGVTSKANVFTALKHFDPKRYGELDWPNPSKEPVPGDVPPVWTGPADQEMGYIWDILRELPAFLKSKSDNNPLRNFDVRYIYLTGWSQSCSYITRYIRSFECTGVHAYDGFLAAGGVRSLATPLNRYESLHPVDSTEKRVDCCCVPFIEMNTESEASDEDGLNGYSSRRQDSNDPDFLYRYMEIPGGCHDALDTCHSYLAFDDDVGKAISVFGENHENEIRNPNNYPKYFAFHLALRNLFLWSEFGIAPGYLEPMRQTSEGKILKDAFGNSIGGLRTPILDFPVSRFIHWSETVDPNTGGTRIDVLAGHTENFSAELINELYTNSERYQGLVTENVRRSVARGMILPEDADDMIRTAVSRAVENGLKTV